jgi:splicing factor U2AF subunit
VPLHLRPRKLTNWDMKPMGYDSITAEQAKATGAFLLPCHLLKGTIGTFNTNAPQLGYSYGPTPLMIENVMNSSANSRQLKRLYVGNLPTEVAEQELIDFMTDQYKKLGTQQVEGKACVNVHINSVKNFAYVEVCLFNYSSSGLLMRLQRQCL